MVPSGRSSPVSATICLNPGREHLWTGRFDQGRSVLFNRRRYCRRNLLNRIDATRSHAKRFGIADEIRAAKIAAQQTRWMAVTLVGPDRAVGVIVEDDCDHRHVLERGGGQFMPAEKKAAVA